jgi:hypothetical protein
MTGARFSALEYHFKYLSAYHEAGLERLALSSEPAG